MFLTSVHWLAADSAVTEWLETRLAALGFHGHDLGSRRGARMQGINEEVAKFSG